MMIVLQVVHVQVIHASTTGRGITHHIFEASCSLMVVEDQEAKAVVGVVLLASSSTR